MENKGPVCHTQAQLKTDLQKRGKKVLLFFKTVNHITAAPALNSLTTNREIQDIIPLDKKNNWVTEQEGCIILLIIVFFCCNFCAQPEQPINRILYQFTMLYRSQFHTVHQVIPTITYLSPMLMQLPERYTQTLN